MQFQLAIIKSLSGMLITIISRTDSKDDDLVATIDSDPSSLELKCVFERSSQMIHKFNILEEWNNKKMIRPTHNEPHDPNDLDRRI